MSKYTISGYITALEWRTRHTVLVEGKTDKKVISRVLDEFESNSVLPVDSVIVDAAEIISRPLGSKLGERELVELVHTEARASGIDVSALVDREYREFELDDDVIDRLRQEYEAAPGLVWTRGHSIENYFLQPDYFMSFIVFQFSESVDSRTREALKLSFEGIIVWTASFCLAAHHTGLITRSQGFCRVQHWKFTYGGTPELEIDAILADFGRRGVSKSDQSRFQLCLAKYHSLLVASGDPDLCQWAAHGHIGSDLAWCAVGKIASMCGVNQKEVEQIATGYEDLKIRHAADEWARSILSRSAESPFDLWRFISLS